MELSRRRLLQVSLLGATSAALAACGGEGAPSGDSKNISLWYWPDGLSDKVLDDVKQQFPDLTFKASKIGGDFKQKLITTISARKHLPDITGVKGEDIAYFATQESQFLDLRDLGADDVKDQYVEWKWKQGSTPDGKQIGFPIDIGPTALFYRADIYKKAGLPTDPDDVAKEMATWDDFFAAGVQLKKALPNTYMVVDASEVFDMAVGQSDKRYVDADNKFIGDQDHVRRAWDLAVKSVKLGIDGKTTSGGQDFNAAISEGKLPSKLGAAWVAIDIKSAAAKTSGKWRVAPMPEGPANQGGSFLTITRNSDNPKKSFEIIKWLLSPENQARGYADASLFPSAPAVYKLPALTQPDESFGGQRTIDVLGKAAENVPVAYESPHDAAVHEPYLNELGKIEVKGKDPEAAWKDAIADARKIGERLGVS